MMLTLLLLLTIKHFILDFVYQPPRMFLNKGTYGHIGGIEHSGYHALATLAILPFFLTSSVIFAIALLEFVVHYHMDWFKMWFNAKMKWGATTHNEFWVLLGFDQLVHSLTYLAIVAIVFK